MQIKRAREGEVGNISISHCCIRLSNTDTTKESNFICYHYTVSGAMCTTL